MEEEWEKLDTALSKGKMAVVTGLRRYGKTSLMLTYLNESKKKYVYLDCRLLPSTFSLSSFLNLINSELYNLNWGKKILEKISSFELNVAGFGIKIRNKEEANLIKVLQELEGSVLVIDEAQALRNLPIKFDSILAYAYDSLDLKIVVSGSEVGLLYRFLKVDDPDAPLYGRAFNEVRIKPLSEQKAKQFLRAGFEQEKVSVNEGVVNEAVQNLGGIIGWLTYFGYLYVTGERNTEKIYESAARLAAEELKKALKVFNVGEIRYIEALKIIATLGSASWSDIKRGIEAKLGKVNDAKISKILKNLMDSGFIIKSENEYRISDPVLAKGILKHV